MSSQPLLKLNTGATIPALGFGTYSSTTPAEMHDAVLAALEAGYRHLDCAWYYNNEQVIGRALKTFFSQHPTLTRASLFITTKVWPHLMSPSDVSWSLDSSLKNLGIEYVDAFLIHWPFAAERTEDRGVKLGEDGKYILNNELTSNLLPTWRAMEALYESGKARSIGVSNFTISHLTTLLQHATIPPSINQLEIHPYLPSTPLLAFCKSHNILPVAYSPLGSQEAPPTSSSSKVIAPLLQNLIIKQVAEEKGVSVAQVLIAWGLKRGYVVLPKSSHAERIRGNFERVELSDEELERVGGVEEGKGKGTRFVNPVDMFGFDVWAEENR